MYVLCTWRVNVCLFICPLKGFKTNGKKNADLCNDWGRFVLPTEILTRLYFFFFPWLLRGGGLPQHTILGSHSFLLHLNSQRPQKAEDLFLLYDLLYPWGQGQPWVEQGGHGHSPGSFWVALVGSQNLPAGTVCLATSGTEYKSGRGGNL